MDGKLVNHRNEGLGEDNLKLPVERLGYASQSVKYEINFISFVRSFAHPYKS